MNSARHPDVTARHADRGQETQQTAATASERTAALKRVFAIRVRSGTISGKPATPLGAST